MKKGMLFTTLIVGSAVLVAGLNSRPGKALRLKVKGNFKPVDLNIKPEEEEFNHKEPKDYVPVSENEEVEENYKSLTLFNNIDVEGLRDKFGVKEEEEVTVGK